MENRKVKALCLIIAAALAAACFAAKLRPDAPGVSLIGKFRGEPLFYVPPTTDTLWLSAPPDSFNQVYVDERRVAYKSTKPWGRYGYAPDSAAFYDGSIKYLRLRLRTTNIASCYVTSQRYGEGEMIYSLSGSGRAAVDGFTYGFGEELTIPDSIKMGSRYYCVKSIRDSAFYGLERIRRVEIPASMEWIGTEAFGGIGTLAVVSIKAENLSYCGANGGPAFPSGVEKLKLAEGMKSIPDYAFANLSNLSEVCIPKSVRDIGSSAFRYCFGLSEMSIEAEDLSRCGTFLSPAFPATLQSVSFGPEVRRLPEYMFKDCTGLASVEIPDCVGYVGEYAFSGCTGLLRLSVGKGIVKLPYGMLQGTSLRSLVIMADLDTVAAQYVGLRPQKTFWMDPTAPDGAAELQGTHNYLPAGGEGYTGFRNVERPVGLQEMEMIGGTAYIPEGEDCAAAVDCSYSPSLTRIELPENVEIGGRELRVSRTGMYAFAGNRFVEEVTLDPGCRPGDFSFSGLSGLRRLSITDADLSAQSLFAGCTSLEQAELGEGITLLGDRLLENCPSLREVKLGNDLRQVGKRVFGGCDMLRNVEIRKTEPPVCEEESFAGFPQSVCVLDVGDELIPVYEKTPGWNGFRFVGSGMELAKAEGGEPEVSIVSGRLRIAGGTGAEPACVIGPEGRVLASGTARTLDGLEMEAMTGPIIITIGKHSYKLMLK